MAEASGNQRGWSVGDRWVCTPAYQGTKVGISKPPKNVSFRKLVGKLPPKIIPLIIGFFSILETIHFGFFYLFLGKRPYSGVYLWVICHNPQESL